MMVLDQPYPETQTCDAWSRFKNAFIQESKAYLNFSPMDQKLVKHNISFDQIDSFITDQQIIDLVVMANKKTIGMKKITETDLHMANKTSKKPFRKYFLEELMSFILENKFNAFKYTIHYQ